MKREKFLWPLTQGHHGALVAARNIRDRLSKLNEGEKNTLVVLSQEISGLFARDLEPHFRGEEEELLKVFENHVGSDDSDIKKILQDHQTIRALSTSVTQKIFNSLPILLPPISVLRRMFFSPEWKKP